MCVLFVHECYCATHTKKKSRLAKFYKNKARKKPLI